MKKLGRAATLAALGSCALACRKDPPPPGAVAPAASSSAMVGRRSFAPASSVGPGAAPSASAAGAASSPKPASSAPRKLAGPSPFLLDKKTDDVATGSVGALSALGVIVRTRGDELFLARLTPTVSVIPADGKTFSRTKTLVLDRANGAAVYWVSESRLVRRLIDLEGKIGALEVLAMDASDGYAPRGARSTGGPADERQDVVAYVAQKKSNDGDRRARLFVERKPTLDLSEEGGGASSLTITAVGERRFVAAWLDARSALAPVHGRSIELDAAGEAQLGKENVPWIAPPSESFLDLAAVKADKSVVAMLAVGKNATDFGLAAAPVQLAGPPRDGVTWLDYANGVEPAAVVGGRLCGQPAVAFAEPVDKTVGSARVITLGTIDDEGVVTRHVEAFRGTRIDHLDLWANPAPNANGEGALLAALDGRTVVRRVHCKKP